MAHFDASWTPVRSAPLNNLRISRLVAGFGFTASIFFGLLFFVLHAMIFLYFIIAGTATWVGGVVFAHLQRRKIAKNRWTS